MAFQYPASDLDQPQLLAGLLGEYWAQIYGDAELVTSVLYARAQR